MTIEENLATIFTNPQEFANALSCLDSDVKRTAFENTYKLPNGPERAKAYILVLQEKPAESKPAPATASTTAPPEWTVPGIHRFDSMVSNAIAYAKENTAKGKKVVAYLCEYTPKELIMAAGGLPLLACGGSYTKAVAGEEDLPVSLCPVIKSAYGFHITHGNPIFELADLVIAETTCDGKKKMYEIMSQTKNMHVMELPQKFHEEAAFEHWVKEMHKAKEVLEKHTGNSITEDSLREAIKLCNEERVLKRKIATLAGKPLTGREVLKCKSIINCIPEDLQAYRDIIQQAEEKGVNPDLKDRPRILLTGVPQPHSAEKVLLLIEEAGGAVVVQENCTGIKPVDVLVEDKPAANMDTMLTSLARKYWQMGCSCMTPDTSRYALLDKLIDEFKPDGVIDLIWTGCHTYSVESVLVRDHVRNKHSLPFLKIETDFSPSDSAQITLRLETFLQMIKDGKK
eukprot:GCRY01000484.1.p1 GENE.GCRY01000484.1~~GCRY01000484.1.p1  ORF type:complete len:482 (+),score=132.46 GCRY01000484.1:79-1446(+)